MEKIAVIDYLLIGQQLRQVTSLNIYVLLIVLIMLDFITGTLKGFYIKEFCSKTGSIGIAKHITILLLVTTVLLIGKIGDVRIVGYAFTGFYIFEYFISIMENTHKLGVPYPEFIRTRLIQMHDKFNNWGE